MKPRYIIEQKITAFANKYRVFSVNPDGSKAQLIAYAQQKRFNIKEKVLIYSDESKKQLAFTFRAEKVLDVHGRYFVEDPNSQLIGMFRKDFTKSLTRSTWRMMSADGVEKYTVTESSEALAVMRRFGAMIPLVGELVDLVVTLLKYHFSVLDGAGQESGSYTKLTLVRDHYLFSLDDTAASEIDWRVWVSMGIGLDMLQSR